MIFRTEYRYHLYVYSHLRTNWFEASSAAPLLRLSVRLYSCCATALPPTIEYGNQIVDDYDGGLCDKRADWESHLFQPGFDETTACTNNIRAGISKVDARMYL